MPVDIEKLAEGWLELESDPGLFTLLLEDFGVREVEVREVYDVSEKFWNEGLGETRVFGFIFLFRWNQARNRGRRKHLRSLPAQVVEYVQEKEVVNSMFFARQMVQNSCATHALLSVVLNCPDIDLGPTLNRLKAHTYGMDPENKGWAIANTPQLARDHNAHASPQAQRSHIATQTGAQFSTNSISQPSVGTKSRIMSSCTTTVSTETFHFVSYVPIHGRLYELDGLKPSPIDHGPVEPGDWTAKFRNIIMARLGIELESGRIVNQDDEIHFSLMAVIPHQGASFVRKRSKLLQWKAVLDFALIEGNLDKIDDTVRSSVIEYKASKREAFGEIDAELISKIAEEINEDIDVIDMAIRDEAEKQRKYRIDDARRAHNYDGFITTFLSMLASQGTLEELLRDHFHKPVCGLTDLTASVVLNSGESQIVIPRPLKRISANGKKASATRRRTKRGRPKKGLVKK
ncbi:unnamed protein product [Notodromas monacha]|uniref:ubiquitinyl hydrolase 1 n=1 Tax=Notodromas monacha TaxID=399045 RepID=A0A7R9BQR4_9CRUS|nr:unnamed protein product [Notodromas monacha]CAG0919066.1 unnamed protein product [Notodromas monacha]